MRIIKRSRLAQFWTTHPRAKPALERWFQLAKVARWRHFHDIKTSFPAADQVRVASGGTCVIFDIAGNHYRMITAIHFNRQIVHILRILSHPEYTTGRWRTEL